jgi:protein-S-isoprenylcysteine O-methyltransferase Ste14
MMIALKVSLFILATAGITWLSRASLRNPQSHGFYRYFAWEALLLLFFIKVDDWFADPFSPGQIVSWALLIISLFFIQQGVTLLRKQGKASAGRDDPSLLGIEKTTELVTTGIYRYVRHPFYSSLLFLAWGILFKHLSWAGLWLALLTTALLLATAVIEEKENIAYFGPAYRAYMKETKRFVPFLF